MPPKALEELEDIDDDQGAEEIKDKDDDKELHTAGDDEGIDVDKPSSDDAPEDKAARRKARWTEMETKATQAEERARAAEERAARLEGQFQQFQQTSQRQQRGEPKDDYEDRIKRLTEARASKLMLIRSAVGNEEATAALARESMDLEQQIGDLRMERMIKKHVGEGRQEPVNVEMRILQSEAPQVYANPNMKAYAQGEYMRRVARGAPDSIETARAANLQTLKDFGLVKGPAPAPSANQQRTMGGMSSSGGQPTPTGKVKLSKSLQKIAAARSALMSPNDDDAVSRKKFAKRLRQKGIA
jgi:hypothetical protein